jgi:hypothetical protein
MENTQIQPLNRDAGAFVWGALLIWWGLSELPGLLPPGAGALGVGLILLGLNGVRLLRGAPAKSLSVSIGILALLLGSLQLVQSVTALPFELPIFSILLIALGLILLTRELLHIRDD